MKSVCTLFAVTSNASELFQDIWKNVVRSRERYEVRAKFTTWLYRLAHNRLIDHYRRTKPGVVVAADDDTLDGTADAAFREPDSGGPVPITADTVVWVRAHRNTGGYGGAAFRGSPASGFVRAELAPSFAAGLARQPPLPDGCAF